MKICYLYLGTYSPVKSGVDNKVAGECRELAKMFPGSRFIRFSQQNESGPDDFFELFSYNAPSKNIFKGYFNSRALFRAVSSFIAGKKNEFSFFMFRYPGGSLPLLSLLRAYPGLIVFEHNANERVELKIRARENKRKIPFSLRPSVLAYYLESIFFTSVKENVIGKKCLLLAAGGIAVTPEIAEIEKNRYPGYETAVIPNGIDPFGFKCHERKVDTVLNGVFLAGTYAEWNGIERILSSYKNSGIQDKIHLYFVGRIGNHLKKEFTDAANPTVFFIDYINKTDLEKFLRNMHFAFGTCANQKKGLAQGSVLKVREALSSGLPVVNGHSDPYIQSKPELNRYCVYFPADESDLDFDLINKKIRAMYQEKELNSKIQSLANQYLNWEEMLRPLPAFLEKLAAKFERSVSEADKARMPVSDAK